MEVEVALPELLKRAAAAHVSQTALLSRNARLSYRDVDAAANRVAHALLARGGASGDRIAILMRHDLPHIIALLAILKAGRIVVALNPTHPVERLRQLVDDAEPAAVITDLANENLALEVMQDRGRILRYEDCIGHPDSHDPAVAVRPEQAAALVYTSGSTGQPKAVVQTHRQIANSIPLQTAAMGYGPGDRLPLFASVGGGQGLAMVLCALLNGATLCPFAVSVNGVSGLADWMGELEINVYSSSASIFRNFMKAIGDDHVFHGVRAVRLSSEAATSDDFKLFQRHFPDAAFFVHTLASSETSNIAWLRRLRDEPVPEGRLPVGLPSRGDEVFLIDEAGQPAKRGEIGEIVVKSRNVAAGYWRNDALTAEHFGPDLDGRGTRLVRTGDLGRINDEGLLEFIGRQDDRVKIRGNRIALSEIEDALHRLDGVKQAAVEAIARPEAEPLLVAFVAQAPGHHRSASALRSALGEKLPVHMIPSRIVSLAALPLSSTGKVDRDALRKIDHAPAARPIDSPRTDMERFLVELWRESFNVPEIGRHDDFFDLGGDSLIAAVMSARLHDAFQIDVELAAFFELPVLSDLAKEIERLRGDAKPAAPSGPGSPRPAQLPLTYSQESVWAMAQSRATSFTFSRCCRIAGPLDVDALHRALDTVIARHEMLRTTFAQTGNDVVQIVQPASPAALTFQDMSSAADPKHEAARIWKAEQGRAFDLRSPPLVCFTLIRLQSEDHWLVYTAHAILMDGWSWNVFFRDLAQAYEAAVQPDDAPGRLQQRPPALQHGDYSIWEQNALAPDSERYRDLLTWWTSDILAASYPDRPRYRQALSWCLNTMRSAPRPLKQVIGLAVRSVMNVPPPPRSELPFKRTVPVDRVDPEEGMIDWELLPDVSSRLRLLGRREAASYFVTCTAAYVAMLAAETREADVILYTGLSNRNRPETRHVFGLCTTPAILMFHCDRQQSFRQLLNLVRDRLRAMQLQSGLPYDRIHREMRAWKIKMPQGRAVLTNAWTHAPIRCGGVKITFLPERFATTAPHLFEVVFGAANNDRNCKVSFDAAYYDPAKVRAFAARFAALLDFVASDPDKPLAEAFAAIEQA